MAGEEFGFDTMVDNQGMADDYFSQYEMVDDQGNPVDESQKSQPEPQQPAQGNQQQQPQQPAQPAPAAPNTPQGFVGRFYKQDDKGNQVFDTDAAHGFLFNPEGPAFAYQSQHFAPQGAQPAPQAQQQGQQQQQEIPEWKRPFVERQEYEKQQAEQMLLGINRARQTLGQNADPQTMQFLDWQEQQVRQYIREELVPKWEFEKNQERAKREHEERERTAKISEYRQKAEMNKASLASKMGGEESFNSFFFGEVVTAPDGKQQFVKGPATDAIYHLFDLQNPDKRTLHGDALQKAMGDWWSEFASNPQNLHFAYEAGLAKLQRDNWSKLVDKIGATKEAEIRGNGRAATTKPGGGSAVVNYVQPEGGHPELNRYLYGQETI